MDNFYCTNFRREIKWDKDVMKVTDSISDGWKNLIKEMADNLNDQTEGEILRHFEIDLSELREFLRYKAAGVAVPMWTPVTDSATDSAPKDDKGVLAFYDDGTETRIIPATYHPKSGWYDCLFNKPVEHITHWIRTPIPPKSPWCNTNEWCATNGKALEKPREENDA